MRQLPHQQAGNFNFKSILPVSCSIPLDGAAGQLIRMMGRHPFRSAHVHFTISASGHRMLLGIRFRPVMRYLESDTVFGVKPSLIMPPEKRVVLDRLPLRP